MVVTFKFRQTDQIVADNGMQEPLPQQQHWHLNTNMKKKKKNLKPFDPA